MLFSVYYTLIEFYFTCMNLFRACKNVFRNTWVHVCASAHVHTCTEAQGQPQVFSLVTHQLAFLDSLSFYLELAN